MCGGGGGSPPTFNQLPSPEPPTELVLDAEGEARAGDIRRRRKLRQGRTSLVTPGLSGGLSIGGASASASSDRRSRGGLSIGGSAS